MNKLEQRAGILVCHTPTGRWAVKIRAFPNRFYDEREAPAGMSCYDLPQHFAQMRIDELKLEWQLSGLTFIENVGYVLTTN
jgi:Ni2+-binding GTPase involved in maturation of urease and hydrogenase